MATLPEYGTGAANKDQGSRKTRRSRETFFMTFIG
jgi:hypothetical protein